MSGGLSRIAFRVASLSCPVNRAKVTGSRSFGYPRLRYFYSSLSWLLTRAFIG